MRHLIIEQDLREIANAALPFEALSGKTVLVTGANGLLPAYLVESLLYQNEVSKGFGLKVIALVRNRSRAENRFRYYLGRNDLEFVLNDLSEPLSIDGPIDYMIHAASRASPKYYGIDPVGILSPNVFGTHHLLQLALKKKSQGFLFFSSGEVYGEVAASKIPTGESSFGFYNPAEVRACYGESKRMGEALCVAWFHQFGVPALIVRPFHTYGPGIRFDDGRIFSDFVADIVQGRDLKMKSNGAAMRAYCYLSDATIGFFTVLLKGTAGEAYNIGNPKAEASVIELAEILIRLYPEKNLRVHRVVDEPGSGFRNTITRNCPDISKAAALGWTPKYSIQEGFRRTIESFF